ncbi:nuclear transport factor 2 family protein [Kribbella sp. NPDC056861]|uniref:nuclear transport factor 2 family protein n=1 Tax=Kribbella sp. NPDC056861 TaxID=3154857 RepID=UPI0034125F7D
MTKNWIKTAVAVSVATVGVGAVAVTAPASAQVPAAVVVASHSKSIVGQWESAWTKNQPAKMAALFTRDAVYTDLAFGAEWHGQAEIGNWVTKTHAVIKNTKVTVHSSFSSGNQIAIEWTFSGVMPGATKPFAVPATTIIKLRGEKIVSNSDYYNLAALLKQSGLPADWPGAGN